MYAGVGRAELGAGDDRLDEDLGADLIVGRDRIRAGAGRTWWSHGPGSRPGGCGRGRDRAFVSGNDVVRGCERVELGSPD